MGFPSPAADYTARTLNIDTICQISANSLTVETTTGFAVVERGKRPKPNDLVLIDLCGKSHFARVMGESLITDDGEAIEGDALDDVTVAGVVTFIINRASGADQDDIPVM
ncbi:hypothetical protein [Escherichia coli]|uniref:hypothetical protein n=1 Tax=Escherichia coli TaxID=562 RepID=UPI001A933E86|nr:hypothetical protein [Escherichia coli]MBO0256080.1 hypothetical protein [Escherichia coli]